MAADLAAAAGACSSVICGDLEIRIQAGSANLSIRVRAPTSALPLEIEACFFKVATAIARVEKVSPSGLGFLAWEWAGEWAADCFVLTRGFTSQDYANAFEHELRAIIREARRKLH